MTQRERLIELLKQADEHAVRRLITDYNEAIADNASYLLDNGVIVSPYKVGDTVYVISDKHPCCACMACTDFCHRHCPFDDKTRKVVKKATVDCICFFERVSEIHVEIEGAKDLHSYSSTYYFTDFGKTVFLTKEESEKALAERNKA